MFYWIDPYADSVLKLQYPIQTSVVSGGVNREVSVAVVVGDRWHVKCDIWQVTGCRWYVTGDKWQVKDDIWQVAGDNDRWQVAGYRWQVTGDTR